jgi:F-box and leucine-rich repeat protein 6
MDVNFVDDLRPQASSMNASSSDVLMQNEISVKEEKKNCTTDTEMNDNDDSILLTSLPKAEVKLKKLDETKLLMDSNENSLSVDTLIEILSSNNSDTKLPIVDNVKSELTNNTENGSCNNINVPPSTINSPSSSSSSKTGFSSPLTNETTQSSCPSGPSPKSTPKKYPSPYYSNGGKPMIADLNKKLKRRQPKPKAVYQSQISDNSVGIKLCIKKSINTFKSLPLPNINKTPRKRSRKSKAATSKGRESDSDESYVKRRKKSSSVNNNNNTNKNALVDEPVEQSGWGSLLPKEVLLEVGAT